MVDTGERLQQGTEENSKVDQAEVVKYSAAYFLLKATEKKLALDRAEKTVAASLDKHTGAGLRKLAALNELVSTGRIGVASQLTILNGIIREIENELRHLQAVESVLRTNLSSEFSVIWRMAQNDARGDIYEAFAQTLASTVVYGLEEEFKAYVIKELSQEAGNSASGKPQSDVQVATLQAIYANFLAATGVLARVESNTQNLAAE